MFLSYLNDSEKEMFLELASQVARSDGVFCEKEKEMMEIYRKEMNMPENEYKIKGIGIDHAVSFFSKCPLKIQKYIFIEIGAIIFADGKYHEAEKGIVDVLKKAFAVSDEKEKEMFDAVNEITKAYRKMESFIEE